MYFCSFSTNLGLEHVDLRKGPCSIQLIPTEFLTSLTAGRMIMDNPKDLEELAVLHANYCRHFFCPNSTQVHSSKILWKWVSAFWKWVLDFWKWVSGILEMSFDIFYWKFYIWDWIFNFLLKFQDFCKWKFVKTVIMYEFLAFLTQLITFKTWKHVKIAEK